MAKRIMILATDGFEQAELEQPKQALEDAGFETVVVAPHEGEIRGWQHTDWGTPVKVDMTLEKASEAGFDALVLPGGVMNPDKLRKEEKAIQLVKGFCAGGKTIAAICHGPWLLAEAEVIDGKTVTSWPSIRTDLKHAGANVVDQECVEDGNLITSRKPGDIPAFSQAVIRALKRQQVEQPA
jgi:protease I